MYNFVFSGNLAVLLLLTISIGSQLNTNILSYVIFTETYKSANILYITLIHNRKNVEELLSNVHNFLSPGRCIAGFKFWKLPDS